MKLYPHQKRAWDSDKRWIALVGGTGAGKTFFSPLWLYRNLTQPNKLGQPAIGMAVGTGYKKHVANLMVPTVLDFLDSIDCEYQYREDKNKLFLPYFGSTLLFGSSEVPNSLEGPHVDFGWMDEAGLMSRLAYDVLSRRTGARYGQVLITTIPYFQGWLKTDIYDPWLNGTDEGTVEWIPCSSADNPEYDRRELERQRKNMRPDKFAIYYEGKWSKPAGLIFPEQDASGHDVASNDIFIDINERFPNGIPHDWPAYAAHDWGFNAPTTGVWGRLSPDDVLYLVADYQKSGMTIDDHVVEWGINGLTTVDRAFGDPSAPEQWEKAARKGYIVEPAENSISAGLDAVTARLKTKRLLISKECQNVIDGLGMYVWEETKDNDKEFIDRPKKPQEAEHIMDALRYLCISLEEAVMPTTSTVVASRSRSLA